MVESNLPERKIKYQGRRKTPTPVVEKQKKKRTKLKKITQNFILANSLRFGKRKAVIVNQKLEYISVPEKVVNIELEVDD